MISRRAAIEAIEKARANVGHNMERAVGAAFIEILDEVGEDIGRLPSIQFATDTNIGRKLSTNLAQLGTDCISRQDALDICDHAIDLFKGQFGAGVLVAIKESIEELPSAEPKIIYCKDCRKHNKKVGFDENFHTVWKEDACPLASWRGKAQGHEFDYQFCAFAERRT